MYRSSLSGGCFTARRHVTRAKKKIILRPIKMISGRLKIVLGSPKMVLRPLKMILGGPKMVLGPLKMVLDVLESF